jgi:hypothetical protein
MLSYHPMSVVTDVTGGISVTCVSYDGRLDFGVVACPTRVPDVWNVIGHLREAMDELLALVGEQEKTETTEESETTAVPGQAPPVREKIPA